MKESTLTSADAVRIALLVQPEMSWVTVQDNSPVAIAIDHTEAKMAGFSLLSLDDLHRAEVRLIEAGLGGHYREAVERQVWYDESIPKAERSNVSRLIISDAPTRARAILAVLDAHSELEKAP